LRGVVRRIRDLAWTRRVRFTAKAFEELRSSSLRLSREEAREALAGLSPTEFRQRIRSRETNELMYVFQPRVSGTVFYLKVVLRDECVVISFHEEEDASGDSQD